jgi:hypothetical protein
MTRRPVFQRTKPNGSSGGRLDSSGNTDRLCIEIQGKR